MHHSLFTRSLMEAYLGCFLVLSIKEKAAINIHVKVIVSTYLSSSFAYMPRSPVAGLYGQRTFIVLRETPDPLPRWLLPFASPPAVKASAGSPTLGGVGVRVFSIALGG